MDVMSVIEKKLAKLETLAAGAYLLVGQTGELWSEVKKSLHAYFGAEFFNSANPDFLLVDSINFSIDHSRQVKEYQNLKPVKFPAKIIVLKFSTITIEAQNALLKTLEEPAPLTYFFILTAEIGHLLPTILSRCQIFSAAELAATTEAAEHWLGASVPARFILNKELATASDDLELPGRQFLRALLLVAGRAGTASHFNEAWQTNLAAILEVEKWSQTRGISWRLLLDYLALNVV